MKTLLPLSQKPRNRLIGRKAEGLRRLYRSGFPVPRTWVIPEDARKHILKDPESGKERFLAELRSIVTDGRRYAVRSSGEIEDGTRHSFAGQFVTRLNIHGEYALWSAVEEVWDSSVSVWEGAYQDKITHPEGLHCMAVIIQEMIQAKWSGVAFSLNPVTGRNEEVIEAVRGSGEDLVQHGHSPERWIHHQGSWEHFEESEAPPIEVLNELISSMSRLKKLFGGEVDVEWVWDGTQLWYLQCRAVTTGKYPTIYSNHISREVLPGMIKPLVWSINIPVVNSAWIKLLSAMLGKLSIEPEQLSRAFYYRAYFNMGTLGALFQMMGMPRNSLESLMGRKDPSGKSSFRPSLKTMKYLPNMVFFLLSNTRLASKFRKKHSELVQRTDQLQAELADMDPGSYSTCFKRLSELATETAYWNIVIPLAMQISHRLLKGKMERLGLDLDQFDVSADFPELRLYDPQIQLEQLHRLWKAMPEEQRAGISSFRDLGYGEKQETANHLLKELERFLRDFGHFSESGNDFSSQPWREDPEFIFKRLQEEPAHLKQEASRLKSTNVPVLPRKAYRHAGRFRLYREMISSTYTRTYGLFRVLYLNTGKELVRRGMLDDPVDVFYLSLEEHDQVLLNPETVSAEDIKWKIHEIKQDMEASKDLVLPSVIYGDTPPPLNLDDVRVLKGISVSAGVFEGEIVVVNNYQDFNKPVDGRILIIPFSDVGWTPILTRAGAIVSESGGVLSHASIVARELSIPAISSVDHACSLKDGEKAIIDGSHGMLTLHKNTENG